MLRMKRSTSRLGPVSAESIGGSSGGKQRVVNPIRKHNTVAQAYAIASASRKRLELINEGIIPTEEQKHLNWPIVWLKPKTGSNTEAHIHTQKPKALVFDSSRADGSYQTMSIKQALSKFAGRLGEFVHLGDAIPSQAILVLNISSSKTPAAPGKIQN